MPHPTGNSSALSTHILTVVLACPVHCSKQKSHKFPCLLFFVHFQSTIIVEKTVQDLMNLMHDLSAYSDQFLNMVCVKLQEYKDTCSSAYRYSWGGGFADSVWGLLLSLQVQLRGTLTQCGAWWGWQHCLPCLLPCVCQRAWQEEAPQRQSLGSMHSDTNKGVMGTCHRTHGQRQLRWLQWLRSRVSPDFCRDLELLVWLPQGNFRSWLVHLVSEKVLIIE